MLAGITSFPLSPMLRVLNGNHGLLVFQRERGKSEQRPGHRSMGKFAPMALALTWVRNRAVG
jgi:hypothetical protein